MFARFLLLPGLLAAQWTPELQMKVESPGDVTVSRDGRFVAWTQSRWVMDTTVSEQETRVFVARTDGAARRVIARGSAPVIAADGFVYYRANGGIHRAPAAGGEPQTVLAWNGALGGFAVSPDGRWIAFGAREPDPEREAARREKRDWKVLSSPPPNHAVWIAPAEPNAAPRRLWQGAGHASGLAWSPDSRRLACELRPSPYADDGARSDIYEVDVATGAARPVAATEASERQPRYSPSGTLAFVASAGKPLSPGDDRIFVAGAPHRELARTPDQLPRIAGWSDDGKRIFFTESRGTRRVLFALPLDGPPEAVFAPSALITLEEAGSWIGFVMESAAEAPEVYVKPLAGGEPVRVSAANVDLPKPPLGKTEVIRWKARDGVAIEGLLTYPVGYEKGKRYPLILNLHGGPYGNFSDSFLGRPGLYPLATFAARGWVILRPNPRQSTGYGRDFRWALLKDWGGVDLGDDQAGVDHLIAQGIVDPARMAVMGWSYGGYMTNWTITQTNRFKAAAAGAGMSNLVSQTGNADIRANKIEAFGAPWDNPDYYLKRSPIFFAHRVKTPLLILHGEADERVPISQGYEMYHAMQRLGVPSEMVAYPRTPHGPREAKFVLDIMQRHLAWVEKYVR
jgi:dipeptidyl aminopeptidase/acylaminoacyl peptidase